MLDGLDCNRNLRKLKQHNARRVGHRVAWTDFENGSGWEKKLLSKLEMAWEAYSAWVGLRSDWFRSKLKRSPKSLQLSEVVDNLLRSTGTRRNAFLYPKDLMNCWWYFVQRKKKANPKKAHGSPFQAPRSPISDLAGDAYSIDPGFLFNPHVSGTCLW